ncbi:hypothetical protein HPB47_027698 [Ixodes persulcatus]|uniref:Uncharacterized protein n=1 Tax=Ixodes persulcatus TaxID=34615 RepID=A0AC60PXL0_IXOPE|nr:hypothetical protein HPB47_027698 [Ixodes persulcatus]
MSGRPYKATDFKEVLFSMIDRTDLIALGPYQMSHVWMAVFANGAAKCKIKACEELEIKQKRCLVIDPTKDEIKMKLLWLPPQLPDIEIKKVLEPFGTVKDISREKWRFSDLEETDTLTRIVTLALKDHLTVDKVPHTLNIYGVNTLVVIPGRPPLCLRCKAIGHIRRQCSTPRCTQCWRFGHSTEECIVTYATKLQGNASPMADVSEHIMDVDEMFTKDLEPVGESQESHKNTSSSGASDLVPASAMNPDPSVLDLSTPFGTPSRRTVGRRVCSTPIATGDSWSSPDDGADGVSDMLDFVRAADKDSDEGSAPLDGTLPFISSSHLEAPELSKITRASPWIVNEDGGNDHPPSIRPLDATQIFCHPPDSPSTEDSNEDALLDICILDSVKKDCTAVGAVCASKDSNSSRFILGEDSEPVAQTEEVVLGPPEDPEAVCSDVDSDSSTVVLDEHSELEDIEDVDLSSAEENDDMLLAVTDELDESGGKTPAVSCEAKEQDSPACSVKSTDTLLLDIDKEDRTIIVEDLPEQDTTLVNSSPAAEDPDPHERPIAGQKPQTSAPAASRHAPFMSEDPEENNDNENPEWERLRQLSTDEERYEAVRNVWHNSTIPNPHSELTTFHYRQQILGAQGTRNTPVPKQHKRKASRNCSHRPAKRQRMDTDVFDLKLKALQRKRSQDFQKARQDLELNLGQLQSSIHQNQRRGDFQQGHGSHHRNHRRANTTPWDFRYYQQEEQRLHAQFVAHQDTIHQKYSAKENKLLSAREEVRRFDKFYVGLQQADPTLLTEEQLKEQLNMEKLLGQFRLWYKNAKD